MQKKNNNKNTKIIIITLLVCFVLIGILLCFTKDKENVSNQEVNNNIQVTNEIYENKTINENKTLNSQFKENKELFNKYVSIEEKSLKNGKFVQSEVTLKGLPEELIKYVEDRQKNNENYVDDISFEKFNDKLNTNVYGDILTFYIEEYLTCDTYSECEIYGFNYDLKNNILLSNQEVLKRLGIDIDKVASDIVDNICSIEFDYLLLSDDGDITSDRLYIETIKENKEEYVDKIKEVFNSKDGIFITIDNDALIVKFMQSKVLRKINLSSHMDIGLVQEPITLKYSMPNN